MNIRNTLAGAAFASLGLAAQAAVVMVETDINTSRTWSNGNTYVLSAPASASGVIRVLPGVTLTIQAGTVIRGQPRTSASSYDAGSLAVLRGAKIIANGNASNPIVFTTAAVDKVINASGDPGRDGNPDGFFRSPSINPGAVGSYTIATRYNPAVNTEADFWDNAPKTSPKTNTASGLWGGVMVLGRAPSNAASEGDAAWGTPPVPQAALPTQWVGMWNQPYSASIGVQPVNPYDEAYTKPIIEGLASPDYEYGSDWRASDQIPGGLITGRNYIDCKDDSGTLAYISIRHGGVQLTEDNEINGLTLAGVGSGTKIENIEVWGNEDDGIELFGGTVSMKNIVITGTKDDGFDLDEGYSGDVQFLLVIGGSYQERLGEWDGDNANESTLLSNATSGDNKLKLAKVNFEPRAQWEIRNATFIQASTDRGEIERSRHDASGRLYNVVAYRSKLSTSGFRHDTSFWNELRNVVVAGGIDESTKPVYELSASTVSSGLDKVAILNGLAAPAFVADVIAGDAPTTMTRPSSIDVIPATSPQSGPFTVLSNRAPFFSVANYRGAFNPSSNGAATNTRWTKGWTAVDRYLTN